LVTLWFALFAVVVGCCSELGFRLEAHAKAVLPNVAYFALDHEFTTLGIVLWREDDSR